MANVKVNTISKVSGNNVAMQNSLNLKSYTTT